MAQTLDEQLTQVQSAIQAAEIAQETESRSGSGGRRVTRANLSILYAREKDLLNRIALRDRTAVVYADFTPREW